MLVLRMDARPASVRMAFKDRVEEVLGDRGFAAADVRDVSRHERDQDPAGLVRAERGSDPVENHVLRSIAQNACNRKQMLLGQQGDRLKLRVTSGRKAESVAIL